MERCKQCDGIGKVVVKGNRDFECNFCEGTGEVGSNIPFFQHRVQPLVEFKQKNSLTFKKLGKLLGFNAANLAANFAGKLSPFKTLEGLKEYEKTHKETEQKEPTEGIIEDNFATTD